MEILPKNQNLKLKFQIEPIIAMGTDNGNRVLFYSNNQIQLSENHGDLSILDNYEKFQKSIKQFIKTNKQNPKIILCDKHPNYISSEYAKKLSVQYHARLIQIQHHVAHSASVGFEKNLTEYIGIICDGLGYGDDGNLWGGEVIHFKNGAYQRIGHLETQPMLGGDSATHNPRKMLFGILHKISSKNELKQFYLDNEIKIYLKQIETGFNVFQTSSCGRILDSISILLGAAEKRTYEGSPAIELEKFASNYDLEISKLINSRFNLDLNIIKEKHIKVLNTTHLIKQILKNLSANLSANLSTNKSKNKTNNGTIKEFNKDKYKLGVFAHHYIAYGLLKIAENYLFKKKLTIPIVFSGGVGYNKIISGIMQKNKVLINNQFPCGDSNICIGQAYYASQFLLHK